MRGRVVPMLFSIASILLGTAVFATPNALENVKATGVVSADVAGKVVGETFSVPASTSRSSTRDLDIHPLADAINFSPNVLFVQGVAGAGYSASVHDNVITGSSSGAVSAKADQGGAAPNSLVMSTQSTMTFDFQLVHTVAADLNIALQREEGFSTVHTSLSGPATQPKIELEATGNAGRQLILAPGTYRLTFTHLTAAAAESNAPEPTSDSKGGATFSFAVDPCGADCNGDHKLDILDFICFQQRIDDRMQKADLNDDGKFDILDMIVFQELFVSGCN